MRRFLQVIAVVITLIVGVAVMAVVVSQTAWFKDWLRGFIVRQSEDYLNGQLSIGRLDGNLFFTVEMEDVGVTMNGKKVIDIKDVGLQYNVLSFILGHAVLDHIRVNEPVLRVEKTAEGWNLTRLMKVRTPDKPTSRRRPIEIGEIGVSDGTIYIEDRGNPDGSVGTSGVDVPSVIDKLDASLGVTSDEDALKVVVNHVSLRSGEPRIGVNSLSGTITRTKDAVTFDELALRTEESSIRLNGTLHTVEGAGRSVDLKASSDKFNVEEIARVIPALRGYALQPAFEISATGPLDRMAVDFNARDARLGGVIGDLTVDWTAPGRTIAGDVSLDHFNMAPLFASRIAAAPITSDIVGNARLDLALNSAGQPLRGTYTFKATKALVAGYEARNITARGRIDGRVIRVDGKADAYGGRATAVGTITTGRPFALQLAGRAAHVDLRNLPPVFQAPGLPSDLQFSYTLSARNGRYIADTRLDASMIAGASIAPGTTGSFAFGAGAPPTYSADGRVIGLDLQQIGRGFAIRMLAEDRFKSSVNGTFGLQGSGGGRYPFTLDAMGTIAESELFGASVPRMDFTTHFGGGDAQVQANGRVAGLDPAVVFADDKLRGQLTGTVDATTTLRAYAQGVTIDSFDVNGRADLERSSVGDLTIDGATVQGTYANRSGEVAQLSIVGPDLNATAKGPIALNDTGSSNLVAHVETPSLDRLGKIIGRPLDGAAVVDATITGNGQNLKAAGMLQGSNIAYGTSKALTLDGTFDITLPQLTAEQATIHSDATATFVEVGGQSVRQLTADTTYAEGKLAFKAVAQEGMRQLAADGNAILETDHQEVHLTNLALKAEQVQWQLAPGTEADVKYGNDQLGLENLHLISGDQQIDADGVLGSNTETLRVQATNVDVAQLDRLALGDQRLAGRLTANANVSGPIKDPRAEGDFTLSQGAFRAFKFDSLAGKVNLAGRGMNIDVKLQQSPQAWLTATGYAPLSLFRRNPEGTTGHEVPGPGEGIDIKVESTQVDLGVIQGFTSYVTNVTGAMQANVRITGTGRDPHLDGVIDIRGGAFAIPDLGTAYTGLDTRIDLKPDAVTIGEMRILDKHNKVMTVGGTIGVHEREVGAVDVKIQSQDFEVSRNDYARLNLDSDLHMTGELRAPRIEGAVQIESGSIDAGRILEETTANPYSTTAANDTTSDQAPSQANIFDALDLNVGVVVPSNLVIRGTNLRPANATIDIGDMSVTVGGLIQARKAPNGRMILDGEVNTVRGSYTFQGRRFEILRDGRIRFTGGEAIDPLVDLQARRVITSVETFVHVRGTMTQPELTFSSRPPLEEADILALIIFNAPINELGEGQQVSLAERAGALAGGYLASGLTRSIANALQLDEFELQAEGERNLAPTLSIGEQVGNRTYFRIRQGFGAEQATEFILEYQIANYLRLQGSAADTSGPQRLTFRRVERGGLDLIFFFSY